MNINYLGMRLDFNNMMEHTLGERGIKEAELAQIQPLLEKAAQAMKAKRHQMKWRELPHNQSEIAKEIINTAEDVRAKFDNFVVLGIGGSALGPIAVHQALRHMRYNELDKERRGGPKLYVEDNVDPERMRALLDVIDVKKTCFNVITKSGSTSETMAQYLIISDIVKKEVGEEWQDHFIATTDREKGNLIKIAREEGFKTFFVPDGVGGRFSELCPVGLLAAAVCGIDIEELLRGAADMDAACEEPDIWKNAAYMGAALQYLAIEKGMNISVMMPYADSLKYMADWYAQLWAESLGKRYALDGTEVFTGQTPVKALGVTDQHSQVQLYTEGPFDKVVTLLAPEEYREVFPIPHGCEDIPDVSFLGGHTLNELIKSEREATEYALLKAGRMNMTITLPRVDEYSIGGLIYYFEVQTAFIGELLGIDAFDQPGVEEGKNATYALLGKPGFEQKKAELDARPIKKQEYII
ncbi:MAG: glucose-6-phosphate isomerase [Christensenellales bacterium]|jgi:glucose-6-phosphate isomerase